MAAIELHGLDAQQIWDEAAARRQLQAAGVIDPQKFLQFLPPALTAAQLRDELDRPLNQLVLDWALAQARGRGQQILWAQLQALPNGKSCLHANDAEGQRYWLPFVGEANATQILGLLKQLQQRLGKPISLLASGKLVQILRQLPESACLSLNHNIYAPVLNVAVEAAVLRIAPTPHLRRLEAESIHIIREAVAEAENPAMLYSIGKDSSVMLHLARKAFYPAPPPFPLLHVDTRWKFQEMYLFRNHMAQVSGMDLLVHINPEAITRNINPFDHGSALHTDITKTEGLKQALDHYKFDVVFGGARRDEEKSRAKERIFSFRSQTHRWDPKSQRPELWNLYNTKKNRGESIRVFPLSNWTELDVWQYIHQESIPVVPLYFAKRRPVVQRDGMLLMLDDARFRLKPEDKIEERLVRFRTLGCYPLTGAIESGAANIPEIILELINARSSERQGRAIDSDASASMEKKKQEGYF